jgi:hypothetical protein
VENGTDVRLEDFVPDDAEEAWLERLGELELPF